MDSCEWDLHTADKSLITVVLRWVFPASSDPVLHLQFDASATRLHSCQDAARDKVEHVELKRFQDTCQPSTQEPTNGLGLV